MSLSQKVQRVDLAVKASELARTLVRTLHDLSDLAERRSYLGNFADADFPGSTVEYLDAGTIGTLFDFVIPDLLTAYADAAHSGRAKQILQQVAPTA